MNHLHLKCVKSQPTTVSVESFIPLFIYKFLNAPSNIAVSFIKREDSSFGVVVVADVDHNETISSEESWITTCELPNLYKTIEKIGFSGVCCLCRQIIKLAGSTDLLGHKGTSVNGTSESSIWTRFCEIDIINCIYELMKNPATPQIPVELIKFETHLSTPTKIENYYKLARKILLEKNMFTRKNIPEMSGVDELQIVEHKYAEGYSLTIADLILFACYSIIFQYLSMDSLEHHIPLTLKWYKNLEPLLGEVIHEMLKPLKTPPLDVSSCVRPDVPKVSLYKSETRKHNEVSKKLTKQENIDIPLEMLSKLHLNFASEENGALNFDWSNLPAKVQPENGTLPAKRVERKKQQLENLVCEVIQIAQPGDIIVDFCCGTGHLGLVLACALPTCHIILLDNKEESLIIRGKAWADELNLENVSIFQGNINYFNRDFNIGVSLHACGVATDIVLEKCMMKKANFVCTPCCYGGIYETNVIKYPRSKEFRAAGLGLLEYIYLAHAADQAHDANVKNCNVEKSKQGELCMDIVDTDRKMAAENIGYKVILKRLKPQNCTPKNRLLVGIYK